MKRNSFGLDKWKVESAYSGIYEPKAANISEKFFPRAIPNVT